MHKPEKPRQKGTSIRNAVLKNVYRRHKVNPRLQAAESGLHAGRDGVEVDGLDGAALVIAEPDEVGEVLPGHVALGADAERLVAAGVELLDRALEADAQRVGGEAEDLADRAGDARAVDVGVVEGR